MTAIKKENLLILLKGLAALDTYLEDHETEDVIDKSPVMLTAMERIMVVGYVSAFSGYVNELDNYPRRQLMFKLGLHQQYWDEGFRAYQLCVGRKQPVTLAGLSCRNIGNDAMKDRGGLPRELSFVAAGHYHHMRLHHLDFQFQAQIQGTPEHDIGQMLLMIRKSHFHSWYKREFEGRPDYSPKPSRHQLDQLTWKCGFTCIADVMKFIVELEKREHVTLDWPWLIACQEFDEELLWRSQLGYLRLVRRLNRFFRAKSKFAFVNTSKNEFVTVPHLSQMP